jgi:hypothetical protein
MLGRRGLFCAQVSAFLQIGFARQIAARVRFIQNVQRSAAWRFLAGHVRFWVAEQIFEQRKRQQQEPPARSAHP